MCACPPRPPYTTLYSVRSGLDHGCKGGGEILLRLLTPGRYSGLSTPLTKRPTDRSEVGPIHNLIPFSQPILLWMFRPLSRTCVDLWLFTLQATLSRGRESSVSTLYLYDSLIDWHPLRIPRPLCGRHGACLDTLTFPPFTSDDRTRIPSKVSSPR